MSGAKKKRSETSSSGGGGDGARKRGRKMVVSKRESGGGKNAGAARKTSKGASGEPGSGEQGRVEAKEDEAGSALEKRQNVAAEENREGEGEEIRTDDDAEDSKVPPPDVEPLDQLDGLTLSESSSSAVAKAASTPAGEQSTPAVDQSAGKARVDQSDVLEGEGSSGPRHLRDQDDDQDTAVHETDGGGSGNSVADWESRLFIQGPAELLTEDFIKSRFSEFGQLEYVKLLYKSGKPKGMAFVKYISVDSASKAVRTVVENEDMVGSVPVKVSIAEPQKDKRRQKRQRDVPDSGSSNKKGLLSKHRKSAEAPSENNPKKKSNADNAGEADGEGRQAGPSSSSITKKRPNRRDLQGNRGGKQKKDGGGAAYNYQPYNLNYQGYDPYDWQQQQLMYRQGANAANFVAANTAEGGAAPGTNVNFMAMNQPFGLQSPPPQGPGAAGFYTYASPGTAAMAQQHPHPRAHHQFHPQMYAYPQQVVQHQGQQSQHYPFATANVPYFGNPGVTYSNAGWGVQPSAVPPQQQTAASGPVGRGPRRSGGKGASESNKSDSERPAKVEERERTKKTAKRGRNNARSGIRTLQEKFELFADETATSLLPLLDRFEEEGIDFQVFLALTQDDMRELGLKMGDRKRVVMAQEYFAKQGPDANRLEGDSDDERHRHKRLNRRPGDAADEE